MALSAFNHLNALFAAIASALVGIDEVKEYFANKFQNRSKIFKQTVEAADRANRKLKDGNRFVEQYNTIADTTNPLTAKLLFTLGQKLKELNASSENKQYAQEQFLSAEKNKNKQIASRLSLFTFLFFLSLLIASALNESGFLSSEKSDVLFLCHFEITFIAFTVLAFALCAYKNEKLSDKFCEMNFLTLFCIFLIILIPSILLTSHNPEFLPDYEKFLFFVTFPFVLAIAATPFLVLYIRYEFYVPQNLSKILAPYEKQQTDLQMTIDNLIEIGSVPES